MKTRILLIFLTFVLCLATVTAVQAASSNYHNITTITYNNRITDQGNYRWNGGYSMSTSPVTYMDQLGLTYWQTYCSCNYTIDYASIIAYDSSYSWMMGYNISSRADGMAQLKSNCSGQTLRGHDYVQYYWQDSGYAGDGGTLNTASIMTYP
jgi:hypothetical protein